MRLDITIPVLNEESRLPMCLERLAAFRQQHHYDFTVIIADNGSTDSTLAVADKLRARYGWVHCVSVGQRGVGRALKASWGLSSGDVIVGYMDVDLATDIDHLHEVYRRFGIPHEVDVLTGSRLRAGAQVVNRTRVRGITSRVFNRILRRTLHVGFSDGMCGFKFLRHSVWNEIQQKTLALSDDWFFNTELLVKAEWLKKAIVEIPVRWTDDQNSRVRLARTTLKYLREIRRVRCEKIRA